MSQQQGNIQKSETNNPLNVQEDIFQVGQDMDPQEWQREEKLTEGLNYKHHKEHAAEYKGPEQIDEVFALASDQAQPGEQK